jgi:hypothetical protein
VGQHDQTFYSYDEEVDATDAYFLGYFMETSFNAPTGDVIDVHDTYTWYSRVTVRHPLATSGAFAADCLIPPCVFPTRCLDDILYRDDGAWEEWYGILLQLWVQYLMLTLRSEPFSSCETTIIYQAPPTNSPKVSYLNCGDSIDSVTTMYRITTSMASDQTGRFLVA